MFLLAPTAADARDVMIEGESGILACASKYDKDHNGNIVGRPLYEPSKRRLTWENGAIATAFSAEEPERLRGPQHEKGWCDELAAFKEFGAWDMAMFGLRLGTNPQVMISTTPKPLPIIRELLKDKTCVVTRAGTYANRLNLAKKFFDQIVKKYEGTRLGRQELNAEVIEEVEGALWTREMIEHARWPENTALPDMQRIVVSIDPAVSSDEASALTGITAAGVGADHRGYLLEDWSGRFSPAGWASKAIELYDKVKADRIVAEGNQGGEMVRHTIHSMRPNVPVRIVHASRSKQARAEPVSALYEQAKISHVKPFPELEDQLCTWAPLEGLPSPDRLDSMVWGFTDLMIGGPMAPHIGNPVNVMAINAQDFQTSQIEPTGEIQIVAAEGTHDPTKMF